LLLRRKLNIGERFLARELCARLLATLPFATFHVREISCTIERDVSPKKRGWKMTASGIRVW
jgi:hypothetical protein